MGQVGSEGTREVGRLSQRAGSGQEALLLVEEALSVGREWSVGPPGGSGGPPTGPGVVRRPFRLARSGLEAFPVGR